MSVPRRSAPHLGASLSRSSHPSATRVLSAQARPAVAASSPPATAEDRWIAQTLDAVAPSDGPTPLATVRSACLSALATQRMPTTKNEDYRFTDLGSVLKSTLQTPSAAPADLIASAVAARSMKHSLAATVVVVDGVVDLTNTTINDIPKGVFVGSIVNAPADILSFALGAQSRSRGGPFATLNGALAKDAVVVHVPAGVTITRPIHIIYLSSSASGGGGSTTRATSAPRALIVVEEGATAEVVEEFGALDNTSGDYLMTAVTEIELDDRAFLKHSYIELEGDGAAHFKTTLVNQGKESQYLLTEARVGGGITRHDLGVEQLGEATETIMRSFLLAGQNQLHDLHSKLKLDHPDGQAKQVHKCIAADATSRAVFDGNVRVNRLAQRTDAQQLSRNILLAPRATVNVKPNLQIVADDVKCTHGCAVSDLEEEELFYLRSRGISEEAARQVLVYSFGREVVQHLRDDKAMERVEIATRRALSASPIAALAQ